MKVLERFLLVPIRFFGYHLGFGLRRGWDAAAPVAEQLHNLDPRRRS